MENTEKDIKEVIKKWSEIKTLLPKNYFIEHSNQIKKINEKIFHYEIELLNIDRINKLKTILFKS